MLYDRFKNVFFDGFQNACDLMDRWCDFIESLLSNQGHQASPLRRYLLSRFYLSKLDRRLACGVRRWFTEAGGHQRAAGNKGQMPGEAFLKIILTHVGSTVRFNYASVRTRYRID